MLDFANATLLQTAGASALAAFNIDGQQFLAVSNYLDRSKINLTSLDSDRPFAADSFTQNLDHARRTASQLYRLDENVDGLLSATLVQQFDTTSAVHVSYSLVGGLHTLAFAQEHEEVSQIYVLPADVRRDQLFHDGGVHFELQQLVPTRGARTIRAFTTSPDKGGESYFAVSQSKQALECAIEDGLLSKPNCGPEKSGIVGTVDGGSVRLDIARDLNGSSAQSMLLRWNGSRAQGPNIMETLPEDLAGGQVFRSYEATELLPLQASGGSNHLVLLNFQDDEVCADFSRPWQRLVAGHDGSQMIDCSMFNLDYDYDKLRDENGDGISEREFPADAVVRPGCAYQYML